MRLGLFISIKTLNLVKLISRSFINGWQHNQGVLISSERMISVVLWPWLWNWSTWLIWEQKLIVCRVRMKLAEAYPYCLVSCGKTYTANLPNKSFECKVWCLYFGLLPWQVILWHKCQANAGLNARLNPRSGSGVVLQTGKRCDQSEQRWKTIIWPPLSQKCPQKCSTFQ